VTTICEGLRQDIVARGIPEHKVTVIPNAVDIDAFSYRHPRDDVLRRDLSLEGTTVIGFLGSYYAYEGLDLLIDAIPGIARIRPDVRVMLVGGGPEEEALRAQVQSRGIGDKVLFIGRVPQANVQRYYSLVDLLAYPRRSMRLTELVTPLKPLEAMAQGQLLVASDVGGHRELIRDGETGVLFRAGSVDSLTTAVLDLLSKPDRWDTIRENGRRFVEAERTWKQSVGRYQEVCKRLVR
jgi:PEP-CTERM/exosortase A-associated glycosyltransferase